MAVTLSAGDLNEPITLQALIEGVNGQGERTPTWATVATPWAKVVPLKARDVLAAGQPKPAFDARFWLRDDPALLPQPNSHRVVWRGTKYQIVSSAPLMGTTGVVGRELLCTSALKDQQ